MRSHVRFLAVFLAVATGGLFLAAAFSVGVDPYAAFGTPPIPGLTTEKSRPDHITKPYTVLRGDYDTLIVGSSRSRDIFCPDLAALYPGQTVRCYNGGIAHADFPMSRRMADHANAVTPLRRLVVALDFFGFNAGGYTPFDKTDAERFLGQPGKLPGGLVSDVCRLLFSRAALEKAVETINRSRLAATPRPVETADAATPPVSPSPDAGQARPETAAAAPPAPRPAPHAAAEPTVAVPTPTPPKPAATAPATTPPEPAAAPASAAHNPFLGFYPAVLKFYRNYSFTHPRTGASTLDELRDLLVSCRRRGIETSVLINPFHAVMLDVLRQAGLWDRYLAWKAAVADVVAGVNATGPGPRVALWDFSGYNPVTVEPVLVDGQLRNELEYFADPFHYKRNVGALMLRRMIAGEEAVPGFGRELTPAEAAAEPARLEAGHEAFLRGQAAYVDMALGRQTAGSKP